VGSLDFAVAPDVIADASAGDLSGLLLATARQLGASEVDLYLADFQGAVLQPMLLGAGLTEPILAEEEVSSSMAGRAFRTGEPVTAARDQGVRVWVPLVERGERTGVVATLPVVNETELMETREVSSLGILAPVPSSCRWDRPVSTGSRSSSAGSTSSS
jgi:hypothetical protein